MTMFEGSRQEHKFSYLIFHCETSRRSMERKQEEEILEVTLRQQRNDPQSTLLYLFGLVAIMAIVETLITR